MRIFIQIIKLTIFLLTTCSTILPSKNSCLNLMNFNCILRFSTYSFIFSLEKANNFNFAGNFPCPSHYVTFNL